MSRRRSKKPQPPLVGQVRGPDKKGRFWLPIPESEKRLFFYGGVPGEQVRVRRGRRGRRGEQGDLLEVVEPSLRRREPVCPHFGVCGGCTLQHLGEADALRLKSTPLYEQLSQAAPEAEYLPPVASPQQLAYRTKIELTFMGESLGFHRRGRFDRAVDLSRCWLSPMKASLPAKLREWSRRHGLRGWNPRSNDGDLRYLLYRHASCSDQDLAALVLRADLELSEQARADLDGLFREVGVDSAILLFQSSVAGAVVPDREEPLYGPQVLVEELGHLTFELGWRSFYQVNPRAYLRLLEAIKEWRTTPPGSRLVDLFCGVGSIGLYLAQENDELLGIEVVEAAVVDARLNAERNGIKARFEARSAEDWQAFETDMLIVDPPRSGCHPRLIRVLQEQAPAEELFYISCNPHRLMEELPEILRRYRLVRAQAFDFFPQTHHLEFLLQFQRLL